jgi:nitronate monooxygenase
MWPDRRITDLFKIEFPILLAPMAGVIDADIAIAVAQGGGLPSVPCAMISPERAREQVKVIRQRVSAPINLNFFCHKEIEADPAREGAGGQRAGAVCTDGAITLPLSDLGANDTTVEPC